MIYHFILNPNSGKKQALCNIENAINDACRSRNLSYHIYYTTDKGDATRYVSSMVKISTDRQRFLCVGGDGTLSEIVNSAPSNPNVEFGVIPNGSGNDFIKNFSNTELFKNIEAQIDGEAVSLDLIRLNDFYCVNMVNIGFDCSVVKEAERLKKFKLVTAGMSYIFGVAVAFFKKFGTQIKLVFDDGSVIYKKFTLTAIANGCFCGGGFRSAPRALLADGVMDVCAINKVSRLTFIRLVSDYKRGTYLENSAALKVIDYRQLSHFKMEFDKEMPICIDGEIKSAEALDISVVKDGFRFVVPKGSELLFKNTSEG